MSIRGLSTAEVAERLSKAGPNALPAKAPDPLWRRFALQFRSPLIYILLFALAVDLGVWLSESARSAPIEAMAIGLILLFNATLGLYQERRSEHALARLRSLADAHGATVDESMLTGEWIAVDKSDGDQAFSGTLLVRGKTHLEVTRTGPSSAMGRPETMLAGIDAAETPLERRVDQLGRQIARWVLVLALTLGITGILSEGISGASGIIIFAVSIAVAAVPEGLPAVLTVALALGVERMARQRAVVRRLSAVEALGSVTVIATDKTGTLTESRMDIHTLDASDQRRAFAAMVLANDADLGTGAGDLLDLGLLRHASAHDVDIATLRRRHPAMSQRPFDSAWKFARVTVHEDGRVVSYLKGAPEIVFTRCQLSRVDRDSWIEKAGAHAREGFRVLALAWGEGETEDSLSLLGLVLFWDPPRPEVPDAIARALAAGIRVIMITGDHPATAVAVAHLIGIPGVRVLTGEDLDKYQDAALLEALRDVNVFARVRPEQKLRIVELLQAQGEIVAMTGDGINDAPALKRSDVGVAMGVRGSHVSREVSDLVLLDDNFTTIVGAVEEGRGIYENIQKFLRFLFSTNLSEVLLIASGAVLAFAIDLRDTAGALMLPLTAVQILWINLLTDGIPALALALDRTPGVVRQQPRPAGAPLLDRASVRFVVAVGSTKAALALGVLGVLPLFGYSLEVTRAAAFHFMAIGQLFLVYPSRHTTMRPLSNPYLHIAVFAGVGFQFVAASVPQTSRLLGQAALPVELWGVVLGGAVLAWAWRKAATRIVWHRPGASER